jgi:hypothetical protein
LEQEGSAPADGVSTVFGEFFEKLLMTEERAGGLAGFERFV